MRWPHQWLGHQFLEGRFVAQEIIDLAGADDVDPPEDHLRTVFEWYHQRSVASARGAFAGAVAVVGAFLAAALTKNAAVSLSEGLLGGAAVGVLLYGSFILNKELSHLHSEYLASTRLLSELRALRPVLQEHPYLTEDDDN